MRPALEHVSPSSLNLIIYRCPRRWYYEAIRTRGIEREAPEALYGRMVHKAIATYFERIPRRPSPSDIEETARRAFEECGVYLKGFERKTQTILANFVEFEKLRLRTWKQYKPTFVEKALEGRLFEDLPPFRCVVDFYSQADATVIDWKTGTTEHQEEFSVQGKINEMLLVRNGHPCERVMFFGLLTGRALVAPKVTDGWIYKLARQAVDMVEGGRFPKNPSPLCGECPYQLECEFDDVCLFEGI